MKKTMKQAPRLELWSTTVERGSVAESYIAPECARVIVRGIVTGHPTKADGTLIDTSPVMKANGRTITTRSGNEYVLGEPNAAFVSFLKEKGIAFDPENPIRVIP